MQVLNVGAMLGMLITRVDGVNMGTDNHSYEQTLKAIKTDVDKRNYLLDLADEVISDFYKNNNSVNPTTGKGAKINATILAQVDAFRCGVKLIAPSWHP